MKRDLRVLVDVSTEKLNNNGDMAMFAILLKRIRGRYPSVRIKMVTNDPEGLARFDPSVEAVVVVGSRDNWRLSNALGIPRDGSSLSFLNLLERRLRQTRTTEYLELISRADADAGQGFRNWLQAVHEADVVFLTGGGYFTDVFAHHALHLLDTLDGALDRGLPAFIVGCGFEPVSDPTLLGAARSVLPRLSGVTVREPLTSPIVLKQFGARTEKITITGDDAIEMAFAARPHEPGRGIGVNLRIATYNPIPEGSLETVRNELHQFAWKNGAPLLPAPISNYGPSDAEVIRQVLAGFDDSSDGGAVLNTPEKLLAQIAHCRVMVTGSYHAAVFAMSMGVPAICLTASTHYQYKMRGLQAMFQIEAEERVLALDAPDLGARLSRALHEAWENARDLRGHLLQMAQRQVEQGQSAYEAMFDIIDRFSPESKSRKKFPHLEMDEDALCALLGDLVSARRELREHRDYLQFHCDERLKIIDTLLMEQNKKKEKAEKQQI